MVSTREGFLEDFDFLEKVLLETSRKLNRKISEEFLSSSSKKNRTDHIEFAPKGVKGFVLGTTLLFGKDKAYDEILQGIRELRF